MPGPTFADIDAQIREILTDRQASSDSEDPSRISFTRVESKRSPSVWYSLCCGGHLMGNLALVDKKGTPHWRWSKMDADFADTIDTVLVRSLTQWGLKQTRVVLMSTLTTGPEGEIRFASVEDHPIRRQTNLDHAALENVLSYLVKEIKEGSSSNSYVLDHGTTYQVILVTGDVSPRQGKITVDALLTAAPTGRPAQIYDLKGAMKYDGQQLLNDRVRMTGDCRCGYEFIRTRFDSLWKGMLQDFHTEPLPAVTDPEAPLGGTKVQKKGRRPDSLRGMLEKIADRDSHIRHFGKAPIWTAKWEGAIDSRTSSSIDEDLGGRLRGLWNDPSVTGDTLVELLFEGYPEFKYLREKWDALKKGQR